MKGCSIDVLAVYDSNGVFHTTPFHIKITRDKYSKSPRTKVKSLLEALARSQRKLIKTSGEVFSVSASEEFDHREMNCGKIEESVWKTRASEDEGGVSTLIAAIDWIDVIINGTVAWNVIACIDPAQEMVCFYDPATGEFTTDPSRKCLTSWGLKDGFNDIVVSYRLHNNKAIGATTKYSAIIEDNEAKQYSFGLFVYPVANTKLAVIDIDGTITIADVRGYVESVYLGVYTYVHDGIVNFLRVLQEQFKYSLVFLTSRPLAHLSETRQLLSHVRDVSIDEDGNKVTNHALGLPRCPLFVNMKSIGKAVYGEVVSKDTTQFKWGVLHRINQVFIKAGMRDKSVFRLGLGNKEADMMAYYFAGVPSGRQLLVNTSSEVNVWRPSADLMAFSKNIGRGARKESAAKGASVDQEDKFSSLAESSTQDMERVIKEGANIGSAGECAITFKSYCDEHLLYYLDDLEMASRKTGSRSSFNSSTLGAPVSSSIAR